MSGGTKFPRKCCPGGQIFRGDNITPVRSHIIYQREDHIYIYVEGGERSLSRLFIFIA